ncbi:hypothetical protein B0H10DRAFT_2231846 [Mycena sp. CBHHK59/15]|nr:hypothetical protein B0H10DRAFT_2231846 [Mycena sp. CBHHK59/15]
MAKISDTATAITYPIKRSAAWRCLLPLLPVSVFFTSLPVSATLAPTVRLLTRTPAAPSPDAASAAPPVTRLCLRCHTLLSCSGPCLHVMLHRSVLHRRPVVLPHLRISCSPARASPLSISDLAFAEDPVRVFSLFPRPLPLSTRVSCYRCYTTQHVRVCAPTSLSFPKPVLRPSFAPPLLSYSFLFTPLYSLHSLPPLPLFPSVKPTYQCTHIPPSIPHAHTLRMPLADAPFAGLIGALPRVVRWAADVLLRKGVLGAEQVRGILGVDGERGLDAYDVPARGVFGTDDGGAFNHDEGRGQEAQEDEFERADEHQPLQTPYILIHCAHGLSRSPAVCDALLVAMPLVDLRDVEPGDIGARELAWLEEVGWFLDVAPDVDFHLEPVRMRMWISTTGWLKTPPIDLPDTDTPPRPPRARARPARAPRREDERGLSRAGGEFAAHVGEWGCMVAGRVSPPPRTCTLRVGRDGARGEVSVGRVGSPRMGVQSAERRGRRARYPDVGLLHAACASPRHSVFRFDTVRLSPRPDTARLPRRVPVHARASPSAIMSPPTTPADADASVGVVARLRWVVTDTVDSA